MSDKQELDRRRLILSRAIGCRLQLKCKYLKRSDPLRGERGELIDVRRTRATLRFGELGDWDIPIVEVLLPHSVEPDPLQRPLFVEGVRDE